MNVTNDISPYAEDCTEAWRAITIHHLLTHTLRHSKMTTAMVGFTAISVIVSDTDLDKNQVQADAKKLEEQRDQARGAAVIASQRSSGMGLAVSISQISIAMGSICLVVKKKPRWYLSLLLAGLAAAEMARVWMS